MKYLYKIYILFTFIFLACEPSKNKKNEATTSTTPTYRYKLNKPVDIYTLPKKLTEISGLSYISENKLAAINDEIGKLFIYDLQKKEITHTLDFGKNDDYEGLEIVDNLAFILTSSGKIKILNLDDNSVENLDCSHDDVAEFEGIAYDNKNKSLMLAAKIMKGKLKVFEYNLSQKNLTVKFEISENDIEKNEFDREFRPSGIAINPQSQEIYIIASAGKKLIIFDQNGQKIKQYNLDNEIFRQPEGICFSPNGQLFIASEGKGSNGYILQFDYQQ